MTALAVSTVPSRFSSSREVSQTTSQSLTRHLTASKQTGATFMYRASVNLVYVNIERSLLA